MITYVLPKLAIGNADDARHANNQQFDSVLNVAIDLDIQDGFKYRHKVGLLDGYGNEKLAFMSAVLLLHSLLKDGRKVLLHCQEGSSRSVVVAATYITVAGYASFTEGLRQIMTQRNVDNYRRELYDLAQDVLPKLKEIIYEVS